MKTKEERKKTMCKDIHRHWLRCNHHEYIQVKPCRDVRRALNRINEPYYLDQAGVVPYRQSVRCRLQMLYQVHDGYCTPCSMKREGWNFRGYASGCGGWPRYM